MEGPITFEFGEATVAEYIAALRGIQQGLQLQVSPEQVIAILNLINQIANQNTRLRVQAGQVADKLEGIMQARQQIQPSVDAPLFS